MPLGTKPVTMNPKGLPTLGKTLTGGLPGYNANVGTNDSSKDSTIRAKDLQIGVRSDRYVVGLQTEYNLVDERGSLQKAPPHRGNHITREPAISIGNNVDNASRNVVPINHEQPQSTFRMILSSDKKSDRRKKSDGKKQEKSQSKSDIRRIPNNKLADILMTRNRFVVIESNLYYWNADRNYYVGLVGEKGDFFIRQNIPDDLKSLITFRTSEEIIRWLKAQGQLHVSEEILAKRREYVAFANCIVKINDLSIHRHHPNFYFTSVINAEFPLKGHSATGATFEKFMRQVTGGNRQIYFRLQELFGYVISEIREVKAIPFLLGPKDSGKSIVLRLLEHLIGQEFFTNLSFEELNQPSFLCQLFGKKLNSCGEVSEITLHRLDVIKKLSGGDYVMARNVYEPAFKFINKSVLLFAGNDLPTIRGIDRSNAFSQRLVIIPFDFPVSRKDQDIHLLDKLRQEMPYIAKWALHGLKRWCENNYQFTTNHDIEEMTLRYSERNNSVKCFVETCCTLDPSLKTHSEILESAYRDFCRENDLVEESWKLFHRTLQGCGGLKHSRFRLNDTNKHGYIGIGLIPKSDVGTV